jgi:1,2-phenylacetyl-CoA epoxidase PaaB subunit
MPDLETYEVFAARPGKEQPLRHVGSVRAGSPALAAVYAKTIYDEWRWKSMFVVPRVACVRVIAPA